MLTGIFVGDVSETIVSTSVGSPIALVAGVPASSILGSVIGATVGGSIGGAVSGTAIGGYYSGALAYDYLRPDIAAQEVREAISQWNKSGNISETRETQVSLKEAQIQDEELKEFFDNLLQEVRPADESIGVLSSPPLLLSCKK